MSTSLKTCFKCGGEKSLTEFYEHPRMADGHLNKCRECTKLDARTRQLLKRDQIAAYDRERAKRPDRKAKSIEYQRRRRARSPIRAKAYSAVSSALRSGRLIRKPCEVCGKKAEAHHLDYGRPLAVRWLCFKHHREIAHGQTVSKAA